ncbi:MAG: hypothetical protein GY822_17605 [Deltaproteobacteria bacterium]|nr:hypothetical protein [Deltaproteobacteria bacterium]
MVGFARSSIGVVVIESVASLELGIDPTSRNEHQNQKFHTDLKNASLILYPGAGIFALAATAGMVVAGVALFAEPDAE